MPKYPEKNNLNMDSGKIGSRKHLRHEMIGWKVKDKLPWIQMLHDL